MPRNLTRAWPTAEDVVEYLTRSGQLGEPDNDRVQECLDAVDSIVVEHSIFDGDEEELPSDLAHGIVMLSARLYKRNLTIDGVQGTNDFGVVRVTSLDPDVERTIGRHLMPHIG